MLYRTHVQYNYRLRKSLAYHFVGYPTAYGAIGAKLLIYEEYVDVHHAQNTKPKDDSSLKGHTRHTIFNFNYGSRLVV